MSAATSGPTPDPQHVRETDDSAAGRLRAFVDRWTAPDWLGRNDLQQIDDHQLTIADLRAVLDEREQLAARIAELEAERKQARVSAVLGGTDDGRLRVVCPACDWDAVYPSLDLLTATTIVREHVATHVPLCECGCQPGQTCACSPHDCECVGGCPVCDADEAQHAPGQEGDRG